MILYFSATGNTEFIAKKLAAKSGNGCIDLLPRIKNKNYKPIVSKTPFVICTPVYICEMPRFLSDYLKNVPLKGCRDVYFIFTSGGYAGISGNLAASLMRKKKMNYMGQAEFKMPRNYVASDMYPELDKEEILRRIEQSEKQTNKVAFQIKNRMKLRSRYVFLFEKLVTLPFNPLWVKFRQPSKDFYATDKCIGCGKCVRNCPLNNITLKNGRPLWKNPCAHCMACIGNCPVEAIEYGKITQNKNKYNIGKYLKRREE